MTMQEEVKARQRIGQQSRVGLYFDVSNIFDDVDPVFFDNRLSVKRSNFDRDMTTFWFTRHYERMLCRKFRRFYGAFVKCFYLVDVETKVHLPVEVVAVRDQPKYLR